MPPNAARIQAVMATAGANREVALVYDSGTATGVKGGVSKSAQFEIEGYRDNYNYSVWIDADAFASEPKSTHSLTVDGEQRTILGVFPDSIGGLIRLDIGGRNG